MLLAAAEPMDENTIAECLHSQGWWAGEQYLDQGLCAALCVEVEALQQQQGLQMAGMGRGGQHRQAVDYRGDSIHWLDGATAAQQTYLAQMETLRCELNRQLFLGLFELECHFAFYPPGAFYKKHRDSFVGAANRIVSVVSYLNPGWQKADGGELVMYDPVDDDIVMTRVLPTAGTTVVFLSEQMPHEVRITHRSRYSIAGWFRCNASGSERIDTAG